MSPLNSMIRSQPPPFPPSSTHGKSLENEQHQGNWSKSLSRSTSRNSFCSINDNSKYPLPPYPESSSTHSLVDSESLPNLPICVQLNAALAEYERQRPNQTNSEEEVQDYKSLPISSAMPCPSNLRRSRSLYSLTEDAAHMDMIRDDFDSSSTLPSSMTDSSMSLSLHQHTLSFGMPPITEDEESANTYLRQPRVNQRVQLDEDYPGFAITSNGARFY
ncbi:MAG: hypothetical protein PG981_000024 [Wolbachia endosymbiont of Ctenocephalides orientis wCori]|nr:MAG: hypothetical protein PG981_000024 [Wolbachia endosymbiont of Ctenocephalides orientis wCori]